MTSGSSIIFLNLLGRDYKNITCNLVSDSAGMNHSIGLQSALRVKCIKVEWCRVAYLEKHTAKNVVIDSRGSYIPTV